MGYLLIDNKASGGSRNEYDTQACPHCQAVIDKKRWREDGGIFYCSKCNKPLCHHCSSTDGPMMICDPWQEKIRRKIEARERRDAFLRVVSGS